MPPLFDLLEFLSDPEPHSAPVNMAVDEIILQKISVPVLRVYGWLRPAVSFGYFEKAAGVSSRHAGRERVRRWTGGGVVLHGGDFTYSLFVPKDSPFLQLGAAESYRAIHERIAGAMRESGADVFVAEAASPKISRACFENAVRHDVLSNGRKIAGAAQRRTKFGLLHQGSIQTKVQDGFAGKLANKLAVHVIRRLLDQCELDAATALAKSKYASDAWMRKF